MRPVWVHNECLPNTWCFVLIEEYSCQKNVHCIKITLFVLEKEKFVDSFCFNTSTYFMTNFELVSQCKSRNWSMFSMMVVCFQDTKMLQSHCEHVLKLNYIILKCCSCNSEGGKSVDYCTNEFSRALLSLLFSSWSLLLGMAS